MPSRDWEAASRPWRRHLWLAALWLLVRLPGAIAADETGDSFLGQPSYCLDQRVRGPLEPYLAEPGDIMLAADRSVFWTIGHNLALTGQPHHSGIVVRLPDGQMALLEAGPHDTLHVELVRVLPSLQAYESEGWVWIRRRANELTCQESDRLTAFALKESGKRFAVLRMTAQITPFRTRGPVRTRYLGRPAGDRPSYFCSELVTEACVAAGLISADDARPSATFPRDLFMDRSCNPYINCHFKLAPDWAPPARWVSGACSSCGQSHQRERLFQRESDIADMLIDPACYR